MTWSWRWLWGQVNKDFGNCLRKANTHDTRLKCDVPLSTSATRRSVANWHLTSFRLHPDLMTATYHPGPRLAGAYSASVPSEDKYRIRYLWQRRLCTNHCHLLQSVSWQTTHYNHLPTLFSVEHSNWFFYFQKCNQTVKQPAHKHTICITSSVVFTIIIYSSMSFYSNALQ